MRKNGVKSKRGQSAVEVVLMASAIMVVLSIVYFIGMEQVNTSQNVLRVSQARTSVQDIVEAAEDVYSDGAGSKRQVYVIIPEGVDEGGTGIYNESTVNIRVYVGEGVTDVNTKTNLRILEGVNFPKTPGGHWVWITAYEGYVMVGDMGWQVSPQTVLAELYPNETASVELSVWNIENSSVQVNLTMFWNEADVSVDLEGSETKVFNLNPKGEAGDSGTVNVNIASAPAARIRGYSGYILAEGSDGESLRLDTLIRVVGYGPPSDMNVSYILIDTYADSGYTIPANSFDPTETVDIHGYNFTQSTSVALNIYNPNSVLVHQANVMSDGNGDFNYDWDPGMPLVLGQYNVTASDASKSASWVFNIAGCS